MVGSLRIDDLELRYAAVRLCCDLPLRDRDFVRDDHGWVLHLPAARVDRLEYQLELLDHDGGTSVVCDPGNPQRAPGVFGEKSVVSAPGYRAPAWLEQPVAAGEVQEVGVPVLGDDLTVGVWSPGEGELPLLVAHDGPEFDPAFRPHALRRRNDRARSDRAVSCRAAANRQPRRVVFGLGGLRTGAD